MRFVVLFVCVRWQACRLVAARAAVPDYMVFVFDGMFHSCPCSSTGLQPLGRISSAKVRFCDCSHIFGFVFVLLARCFIILIDVISVCVVLHYIFI